MSEMSDAAREVLGGGSLTGGLEKIKLDEIIAKYPNGVAVNGFDVVSYKGTTFPVFTFLQDESKFFSGGMALHELADKWLAIRGGDLKAANDALRQEPVVLKMIKVKTKSNRDFTQVFVVGTVEPPPSEEDKCAPPLEVDPETGEVIAPF